MPSHNIHLNDLKPNTSDAKLILLSLAVEHDLENVSDYMAIHNMVNTVGFHIIPRKTQGIPNPFNVALWDRIVWKEDPHETTDMSVAEITDLRAIDISRRAACNDLPIVVSYSGGIDSTLIVAAMVRNFRKDLLDRVIIKMNNTSYFENPHFYDKVIKNKLKVTHRIDADWDNAIIISGEPGDSVMLPFVLPELDYYYPGAYQLNPQTNPDLLIKWMSQYDTPRTAQMYIEMLLANAAANNFEILTYEDFFWWGKQVFAYGGNVLNLIKQKSNPWHECSWNNFKNNAIAWFDTSWYRKWSATNRNNGVKYAGTLRSFKMPFKEYIYSIDKNPYYRDYKTKTFSSAFPERGKVAALYDDGTMFSFPENFGAKAN